nr:hypothetical protein [Tanacetum cinerariifolium]
MESLNSNFQEREPHQLQQMQDNSKESCMVSFQLLHSHLKALSNNDSKGTCIKGGFEWAFVALFDQDLHRLNHIESLRESILEREEHKREKDIRVNDRMMQSKERKDNLSKALDAGLDVTKSNETESKRHVLSSRSMNDTHTNDADINSVNDKQPMAKVQLSAEHNILANEKHHSEQSESVYDTYLLEKDDRNTTPESTDMSHMGGEIDQNADDKKYINFVNDKQPMAKVQLSAEYNILANEKHHSEQSESVYDTYLLEKDDRNTTPESTDMSHMGGEIDQNADDKKCQVSCPLPDLSFDNMTTEFSN